MEPLGLQGLLEQRKHTYGNSTFVVVGESGYIYTSSDGTSLTSRTSGIINNLWGITYGNSIFVTVSYGGDILTSPDGISWTSRTSGTTNALYDVTYRPQVDGTWWSKGTSAYGKYTLDGSELFFCVSMGDYPSSSCLPPTGWFKQ